MSKPTYAELLNDPRWQRKRLEVFNRDGWRCQDCSRKDLSLHVHHDKYHGLPWEAPMSSLVTVCFKCHKKRHPDIHSDPPHEHQGADAHDRADFRRDAVKAARWGVDVSGDGEFERKVAAEKAESAKWRREFDDYVDNLRKTEPFASKSIHEAMGKLAGTKKSDSATPKETQVPEANVTQKASVDFFKAMRDALEP